MHVLIDEVLFVSQLTKLNTNLIILSTNTNWSQMGSRFVYCWIIRTAIDRCFVRSTSDGVSWTSTSWRVAPVCFGCCCWALE